MLLFAIFGLCWAASAKPVFVTVGEHAEVEQLPQRRPGVFELVLRHVTADLRPMAGTQNAWVAASSFSNTGGGTWFVRIQLRDQTSALQAAVEGEALVLSAAPPGVPLAVDAETPDMVALFADEVRPPTPEPTAPLQFLSGDRLSGALDARRARALLYPEAGPADWKAIDQARLALTNAADKRVPAQELAGLYDRAGLYRQASYYYAIARPSEADGLLAWGRACLAAGRWACADRRLEDAYNAGAVEADVVEGLALLALATDAPNSPQVARALMSATSRPAALLVAVDLLQRNGWFSSSLEPAETAAKLWESDLPATLHLRLGDAYLHKGLYEDAKRAYRRAPAQVAPVRILAAELLADPPRLWARSIPPLVQLSRGRADAAFEASYLLAQVQAAVGDTDDSIATLGHLIRTARLHRPETSKLLWEQLVSRVHQLREQERWFDLVALYNTAWHPAIRTEITNPAPLEVIATAYEELSLPSEAVGVLRHAFSVVRVRGGEDPRLVLRLAELYDRLGQPAEGLRSLEYIDRSALSPDGKAHMALVTAKLLVSMERFEAAQQAIPAALANPTTADAATLTLARAELATGQCQAADARLQGMAALVPPETGIEWARCLRSIGRVDEAQRRARQVAEAVEGHDLQRYARYLAGQDGTVDGASDGDAPEQEQAAIWDRVLDAVRAQEALVTTVRERRR